MNDYTQPAAQTPIIPLQGDGKRAIDIAGDMAEEIKAVIYAYSNRGIPVATVLGVLEIVKFEVFEVAGA